MSSSSEEGVLEFAYRTRKNGEVEIWHQGRLASTLRGTDAVDFIQDVQEELRLTPSSSWHVSRATTNVEMSVPPKTTRVIVVERALISRHADPIGFLSSSKLSSPHLHLGGRKTVVVIELEHVSTCDLVH